MPYKQRSLIFFRSTEHVDHTEYIEHAEHTDDRPSFARTFPQTFPQTFLRSLCTNITTSNLRTSDLRMERTNNVTDTLRESTMSSKKTECTEFLLVFLNYTYIYITLSKTFATYTNSMQCTVSSQW